MFQPQFRRKYFPPVLKCSVCHGQGFTLQMDCLNRCSGFCVKVIAANLPMDEISGMREIFMDIDTDKSGTITVEEFAEALRKKGKNLPEGELNQIMQEADVNGKLRRMQGRFLTCSPVWEVLQET